jgi:hypothetical protein
MRTHPFHQIRCLKVTGKSFDVRPFLKRADGLLEEVFIEVFQLYDWKLAFFCLPQLESPHIDGKTYEVIQNLRYPIPIPIVADMHVPSILMPLVLFLVQFHAHVHCFLGDRKSHIGDSITEVIHKLTGFWHILVFVINEVRDVWPLEVYVIRLLRELL